MKRYYHFLFIHQPDGKVVKDLVLFLSEKEMHEKCAKISFELQEKGISFNGKNHKSYIDFLTKDITDEYIKMKKFFAEKGINPKVR